MGMFTLTRRGAGTPTNGDGTFSGLLGRPTRLEAGSFDLHLFAKQNGAPYGLVERPNGDYVAQTGIFYYHGSSGTSALAQFLNEFDGRHFPWDACCGHFALVIRRQGRLFMATDALGAYKIYHDRGGDIYSSSFVAVQQSLPRVTIDRQGCYEYAWNGGTFGDKTFLNEIRMFPTGVLYEAAPEPRVVDEWRLPATPPEKLTFEDTAQREIAHLRALFRVYADDRRGPVRLALSGGYDSRLLLGLLLDAGVTPELFIYGPAHGAEVALAQNVAAGEGLPLAVIDRTRTPPPSAWDDLARYGHDLLDGWTEDGLLEGGGDAKDRVERAAGDRLLFNGSLGEIYRNFFNLPDGRYRLQHLVWSFYSYLEPRACTEAFRVEEYESSLIADMARAIDVDERWVTRAQIESLYPLFRGRYWTAREMSASNRLQRSLYPFLEAGIVAGTEHIPIRFKQYGRLQARMIQLVRPSLACYPSTRGFLPADPVPLGYRLKAEINQRRPTWARQSSYRYRFRRRRPWPACLQPSALERLVDPTLPLMSEYFRLRWVNDPGVYNRLCTMEWLAGSPVHHAAPPRETEAASLQSPMQWRQPVNTFAVDFGIPEPGRRPSPTEP